MKQSRRLKVGLLFAATLSSLAVLVAFSKQPEKPAPVDPVRYQELMEAEVSDIHDLQQLLLEEFDFYRVITPSFDDFILRQPSSPFLLPFASWSVLPAEFARLPYEYENSIKVYPITIRVDGAAREAVFQSTLTGKRLYALPLGYDPDARFRNASVAPCSNVQILAKLIPSDSVEAWLYVSDRLCAQAVSLQSLDGGMKLMRSEEASSNIVFEAFSRQTNGLKMTIGYPDTFTNRLDIFTCNNLMEEIWSIAVRELSTAGTNEIAWVDTNSEAGLPVRSYCAANADLDTDQDSYPDMRESRVFLTNPNDPNSRPVRISGSIGYAGIETGTIFVLTLTEADSWSLAKSISLASPGAYTNSEVGNNEEYFFKTFRDVNHNFIREVWEPWGRYSTNSLSVTSDVSGIDMTLQDQPSLWGTISYAGSATGNVHVLAVTASNSWQSPYESVTSWEQGEATQTGGTTFLSFPMNFSLTELPATNLWIRAFIDENYDGVFNSGVEAAGQYAAQAISVSNRVTGLNFTLAQDSDSDGMPDWWEWERGFDPTNVADGSLDLDNDEAANWKEYLFNIDSNNPDSDGDGMPDGWEIRYGLAPAVDDAFADPDNDGLFNRDEYLRGTDPKNPDSDGDFIADGANDPDGVGPMTRGEDSNPLVKAPGRLVNSSVIFHGWSNERNCHMGSDPYGRPIVSWIAQDKTGRTQVYVMKCFQGAVGEAGEWEEMNTYWEGFGDSAADGGLSQSTNASVCEHWMDVDTNGWPVVFWTQTNTANGSRAYLKKWNGTNWTTLGASDTGSGFYVSPTNWWPSIWGISVAMQPNGNPCVAFLEKWFEGPSKNCIYVKKWDGTNWVGIGTSTNYGGVFGIDMGHHMPEIKCRNNGVFDVLYWDWNHDPEIYVKRWNGSSWGLLGSDGIDPSGDGTTAHFDLVLDQNGTPYVSGSGYAGDFMLWVRRYTNSVWQGFGGSDVGCGVLRSNQYYASPGCHSLWMNATGSIYIAWEQWEPDEKPLLVKQWTGSNWVSIGSSLTGLGLNPDNNNVLSLDVQDCQGIPSIVTVEETVQGARFIRVRQFQADSDGDGLSDSYETLYGLNTGSSDSDSDGLSDWLELLLYRTDPLDEDSDNDGLLDGEEVFGAVIGFPTDPLVADSDADGLQDGCDWFANSPLGDTDGDGVPDELDPDDDNDGWSDDYEINTTLTNPLSPDSDCDGIPDNLEGVSDATPPIITIIEPEEGVTL